MQHIVELYGFTQSVAKDDGNGIQYDLHKSNYIEIFANFGQQDNSLPRCLLGIPAIKEHRLDKLLQFHPVVGIWILLVPHLHQTAPQVLHPHTREAYIPVGYETIQLPFDVQFYGNELTTRKGSTNTSMLSQT